MSTDCKGKGLNRREWLCLAGAAAVTGCAPGPIEPARTPRPSVAGPKALGDKPNLVVFLADSLRARELSTYGCQWPTSPVIDDFTRQAVLYEHCTAPSSWTKPSVGSIFTGLVPTTHQSIRNVFGVPLDERRVDELPARFVTMAESLRSVGYHTAWSLEHPLVQGRLGYDQGFENYEYRWPPDPARQVERLNAMLRQPLPEPFFLFIHMIDPHVPYMPPESILLDMFGASPGDILAEISADQSGLIKEFHDHLLRMRQDPSLYAHEPRPDVEGLMSGEGAAAWRHFYAGSVRQVDALFGQFLGTLEETGVMERTFLALTSDHGEAFREHGSIMHGHTLYDEETHVPLIVRPPGGGGGVRVVDPVSLLDLFPTFAAVGGAPMPAYLQGAPLFDGDGSRLEQDGRLIFSETNRFSEDRADWHLTGRRGSLKVYSHDGGSRVEAFDLAADPLETVNLAAGQAPPAVRRLYDELRAAHAEHQQLAAAFGPPGVLHLEDMEEDKETFEDLDSVGYV